MSQLKRMKMLVELAERDMDKALQTLKEMQSQRNFVHQQINDLKSYLQEYVAKMTTAGQFYLPIQLQTTQAFIDKLNQAIATQNEQLSDLDQKVTAAQQQWMDKKMRHSSLAKIYDKRFAEFERAQARSEQKLQDDLASQKYARTSS